MSKNIKNSPENNEAKVAILLCTMNGEKYLSEQLQSIARQNYHSWTIHASDDSSNGNSLAIIEKFKNNIPDGKITIQTGPKQGFVRNFLTLTCDSSIQSEYYAFCDQDDIWHEDKLTLAIAWIRTIPANIPALYCARTIRVNEKNQIIDYSPLNKKPPSFSNALVQNIGGGNTMVFNNSARELLKKSGPDVDVPAHDWWTYLLVTGCGGIVFYDQHAVLRYRQHDNNIIGSNGSMMAKISRFRLLLSGRFKEWNDANISSLQKMLDFLTDENKIKLAKFSEARKKSFFKRIYQIWRSGIYRQSMTGNIGLACATLFKKI